MSKTILLAVYIILFTGISIQSQNADLRETYYSNGVVKSRGEYINDKNINHQ